MVFVILAVALLALALALYVFVESRRRDSLPSGRTIAVHTCKPDDRTLRGVLVGVHGDRIVLRDAVLIDHGVEHPLGGAQHVPLTNVSFVQDLVALEPTSAKMPLAEVSELAARK